MPTYKYLGEDNRSIWIGDKQNGVRVVMLKGDNVDLTEEQAADYVASGDLVLNDATARSSSNDAPLPGMTSQYGPEVGTRGVGDPQPGDQQAKRNLTNAAAAKASGAVETEEGEEGQQRETTDYDDLTANSTAADLIDTINSSEDADEVQGLRDAEEAGQGRKTVLAAADARLSELQ